MELTTTIKSNQMMENGVNIFTNYYLQAPALILSKIDYTESFGGPAIGPGHINPRLHLDLIHSPGSYGLSFYGTESFKSNEIRDYTNWIAVPPSTIDITTDPKDKSLDKGRKNNSC